MGNNFWRSMLFVIASFGLAQEARATCGTADGTVASTNVSGGNELTADSNNLYYNQDASGARRVYRISKSATAGTPSLISANDEGGTIGQIRVDSSYVWWTTSGGQKIRRSDTTNWSPSDFVTVTGVSSVIGLAIDSTTAYVTTYDQDSDSHFVYSVHFNDTSSLTALYGRTDSNVVAPGRMTIDGSYLYWADIDEAYVRKTSVDGTSTTLFADSSGLSANNWIVTDGTRAFYTLGGDTVKRINLDGTGAQVLYTGLTDGRGLAIDGTNLYIVDYGASAGRIVKMTSATTCTNSCSTSDFATSQAGPRAILVASDCVYWTNTSNIQRKGA